MSLSDTMSNIVSVHDSAWPTTEGITDAKHEATVLLRALNSAAHARLWVQHIYEIVVSGTQTQAKDVSSRDEKYMVVDRSQTTPGL
jgi:hypothetical protein